MKLFIDNPLTCPCSSSRLYLHDMRLHQEGSFGHGFHLSIYFYCPDCQSMWYLRQTKEKTRLFIKQKHLHKMQRLY